MYQERRQEYVPGRRAASAGRARPTSALNPGNGWTMDDQLSGTPTSSGFRGSRPFSAMGVRARPTGATPAWGPTAEEGDGMWTGSPSRPVHAQSLAKAKGREQLAEDVVALREQVTKLREYLNQQKTEKRRVEQELVRTKASLLKSEEFLNQKERLTSPNTPISQLYRSPDTTQLVGNLRQQVLEHKAAVTRLETELRTMQKSQRATKVSEMQSELLAMTSEVQRLTGLCKVAVDRAEKAERMAHAEADKARRLIQQHGDLEAEPSGQTGRGSLRRTLKTMYEAHIVLMREAEHLKRLFNGMTMKEFLANASRKNSTSGAPDVLNFLRNHLSKLNTELTGQPGAALEAPASPSSTIPESAPAEAPRSSYEAPAPLAGSDLMQAIADNVRKLRVMNDKKWRSSPTTQHTSEQLADIMKLYVDEVQRLQGRTPSDSTAAQNDIDMEGIQSATQKAQASARDSELALKQAQADLIRAQKELSDVSQQADTQKLRETELRNQLAALTQDLKDARKAATAAPADPVPDAVASRSAPVLPAATEPAEGQPWKVVVHTARTSGGSGAYTGPVYLTLNGCGYNTSGELLLVDAAHSFSTGQADSFTLVVPASASLPAAETLTSVGMRIDAADVTWQLSKVQVTGPAVDGKPGATWDFLLEDPLKSGTVNMLFPSVAKGTPMVTYDVYIWTSDSRGAGTDGQVLLTVVGDKGAADAVLLTPKMVHKSQSSDTMFSRGDMTRLAVSAADVGDLSHVVLRLTPAPGEQLHSSWCVDDVRVIHPETGMSSSFYCYDWLTADEPRMTLTEAYTWKAYSTYTVKVKTSNLPGADFQGGAYITLNGCWNKAAELQLCNKGKKEHDFQSGKTDSFKVQADDVGPLNSILLRIEPTLEDNVTWHIEQVVVVNDDTSQECVFNTSAWLHGPTELTIYKDMPSTTYKVAAISAADSAAFAGSVFVTLNGSYGATAEVQLVNSNCTGGNDNVINFAPGGLQEFEVSEKDIGRIDSCTLRVAASSKLASAAPWKLDRIQITAGPEGRQLVFTSGDAMQLSETGGSLTLTRFLEKTDYKVRVFTCDSPDDAGFDGRVFIKMTGLDGSTEDVQLQTAAGETVNPFAINSNYEFTVNGSNVGELSYIEMHLNQTGTSEWWRPNRFEITNTATGQVATFRYNCWCHIWNSSYTLYAQDMSSYKVIVHTSPGHALDKVAPFTGKLFVKLSSYYVESSDMEAVYESSSLIPGGTAVVASFKCPVSWVSYVQLRAEGGNTPVHVRMVEVVNESSSECYSSYFACHSWMGKGQTESTTLYSSTLQEFTLNLHTARGKSGLPASAKVLCSLVDTPGGTATEEVALELPASGAPAGSVVPVTFKTFLYGTPAEVQLRVVDASGSWSLQRASLLSSSSSDGQINFSLPGGALSLPGSAKLNKQPLQQYVVTLNTSDKKGADSDGVVMIRFVGDQGETEDLKMTVDEYDLYIYGGAALSQGHQDRYTVLAADVGKLTNVVVSLAPVDGYAKPYSGWHLATVSTLQANTGVVSHFSHNKWVDPGSEVTLSVESTEQSYVDYNVTLVVPSWCGWYEGDSYITLKSNGGDSTHKILLSPAASVRKEASDAYHMSFAVRASNISLDTVEFQLDPNSSSYYICVKRIQVANKASSAAALFQFGNEWMYRWNGAVSRTAAAQDVYYYAMIRTKNFPNAGWDGSVYLTMNGEEGDAPEVLATSYWGSGFQPDTNMYCYFYGPDVGLVNAVTLRLDAPSASKKWSLDYVELYNYTKSTTSTFELGDKHLVNGDVERIEKRKVTVQYEITTVTSDTRGAGTDGCLYVTLDGEQGRTDEIKLCESVDEFARSRTTTFKVTGLDVGEVRTLHVRVGSRSDDATVHSAWHAGRIEVLNMTSGLKCNFNANKWIDPAYGTEYLTQTGTEQVLQTYRVQITTSSLPGASFDGKAYITLNGWYASTAETALVVGNRSTASFSAGTVKEFTIKAADVGPYLSNVAIRMVPTDSDPRWHIEKVVVISENSTRPQMEFQFNNWLNQEITQATLSQTSAPVRYKVVVATSADAAATWDGQVYLKLNSQWWCSSDELELINSETTLFTPGVAQEFEIATSNIGPLASIDLRLAGGSSGSSLKFDRIEITDLETGKKLDFIYTETLTASSSVNVKVDVKQVDYKINLVTDKAVGNAVPFDGDVYVTMYGMEGSTDEVKLVLEGEAGGRPILKDDSNVMTAFKAADVGQMRYIYLRLDMCGSCCEYNITALEVTNVTSGVTVRLPCGSALTQSWNTTYIYPQSVTTFKVRVTTGSASDADFNGSVYIALGNWYTTGKEVLLSNERGADAFKPGVVEEFTLATSDVSYVSNVTVRVQPADSGAAGRWQLGMIEIWDASCSTVYANGFLYNNWLDTATPSCSLSQSSQNTYSPCEVTMAPNSGPFSGNLWLSLMDESGTVLSNEVLLMSAGSKVLEAGSTAQLGSATVYYSNSLEYVSIRVDNNTASSIPWQPASFSLTTNWGSQYRFEPSRAAAGLEHAGSIKMKRMPEVQYEIKAVTEDVPGNGTDGSLRLVINGSKGASQEVYLYGDHERAANESASTWVADLGQLTSITVHHKDDGSGIHSQWCVGSLQVTQQDTGVCTTFKTRDPATGQGIWVDRGSSATFEVESSTQIYVDYKVTVYTSSATGSGFDGGVRFRMEDVNGNYTCMAMLGKGNMESGPFATGGVDVFTYKASAADEWTRVMVDLDSSGSTSTWGLSRIVVERPDTGASWQFTPSGTIYYWQSYPSVMPTPVVYFNVEAYTNTVANKTFDGSVFLVAVGEDGETAETKLDTSSSELAPGTTCYTFFKAFSPGKIKSLRVRTEGGSQPAWNAGSIKVTNSDTGAVATFEPKAPIKVGAKAIELPRTIKEVDYEITVYTQDVKGAGTDGDVYMKLSGPNGDSQEVKLYNGPDDFKRASQDVFRFKAPDVGDSPTVQIRLAAAQVDGTEAIHSGWALDRVEVLNRGTGIKGSYPYSSWLPMPTACATLTQASSQQALNKYTVRVKTGSLQGAGFDGVVRLDLDGWYDTIKDVKLAADGEDTAHLKDGEETVFEVRGVDVGRVTRVTVHIEPNEMDPAWMLEHINVTNDDNGGYESSFHYHGWLNGDKPSVDIWSNNPFINYKVVLATTDQADAGFDGELYLLLNGMNGVTEEVQLVNSTGLLAPGSEETFTVKAADVAALSSATLRLVGNKKEKKWHMKQMKVWVMPEDGSEPTGEPWLFDHHAWVEDATPVELSRFRATKEYKVTLLTTDQSDAGFEGEVYLTLKGADGDAQEVKLTSTAESAAPAATDTTTSGGAPPKPASDPSKLTLTPGSTLTLMMTSQDVGKINYATIRIVPTGSEGCSTNWHLDSLTLSEVVSGALYSFNYKSFVSADNGAHWLYPQSQYEYLLKVYTSDTATADFTGDVVFKIGNYWADGKEERFSASRTSAGAFKPGSCEEYSFKVDDVGWVSNMAVRVEAAADVKGADKWHCGYFELTRTDCYSVPTVFHLHEVVSTGAESRTLNPESMAGYKTVLYLSNTDPDTPINLEDLTLYALMSGTDDKWPAWAEVKLELSKEEDSSAYTTEATPYLASFTAPTVCPNKQQLQIRAAAGSSGNSAKWVLHRAKVFDDNNWTWVNYSFGNTLASGTKLKADVLPNKVYELSVYTRDVRGNGHDGTVSIVLEGSQAVTNEITLDSSTAVGSTDDMFERGSCNVFTLDTADLGKIKTCAVKLAGGSHSQWQLDRLEVIERATGLCTTLTHEGWISPQDDCLPPSTKLTVTKHAVPTYQTWDLVVWTAAVSDAAYDGDVSVQLHDVDGRSTNTMLLGTGDAARFQVGSKDKFSFQAASLSDLHHVVVSLSDKGSSSSWRVTRIQVTNKTTGAVTIFEHDKLIYSWDGEVTIEEAPTQSYGINVYTSNGDDWNGKVHLTLHGNQGVSKEVTLIRWGDCPTFYANDSRYFQVDAYSVGLLKSISLRTEDGSNNSLVVTSIDVTNDTTSATSTFKWGKAFPASKVSIDKEVSSTKWQLQINTCDNRGAGTDADVYITIAGDDAELPEFKLSNHPDNFSRGRTDVFNFSGPQFGNNKTVSLRLAPPAGQSAPHSNWYVSYVFLVDLNTGQKSNFYSWSWASSAAPLSISESCTYRALYPYNITVSTGTAKGAEFEGEVWIKLHGWWGSTQELLLARDNQTTFDFKAGSTETFSIQADDIGYCNSLELVRIVPTGADLENKWQLDAITVEAVESGYTSKFDHANWLHAPQLPLTIYRTGDNLEYKVVLHTASTSPVDTYSKELLVTLKGMLGECDENTLVSSAAKPLAPGSKEEYELKDSDVGALTNISLAVKTSSDAEAAPAWLLDKLEIINVATGTSALFPCLSGAKPGTPAPTWEQQAGRWVLPLTRYLAETDWHITVVTTDVPDASFDGDVMLTLTGSEGTTGEVRLPADPSRAYNPGQTDTFVLKAADIGTLQNVTVSIQPQGSGKQWHLSDITVSKAAGGAPAKFAVKSYLNDDNPSVTLYHQGPCKYDVTLVTEKDAPDTFKGKVLLTLVGQYGCSTEMELTPAAPAPPGASEAEQKAAEQACALSAGNEAAWVMSCADMGPLISAKIRAVPDAGSPARWKCHKVVLRSERDPATPYVAYVKDTVKDDGLTLTMRRMVQYQADVQLNGKAEDLKPVQLGLKLKGTEEGVASEEVVVSAPADGWQIGYTSIEFEAEEISNLGGLLVRVLDDTGDAKTVSLELTSIRLIDKATASEVAMFWRNPSLPGLTANTAAQLMELLPVVNYKVDVVTGSARGAGTDGDVTLIITGEKGDTQSLSLCNDYWYNFERGRTDSFELPAVDVGTIKSIKLQLSSGSKSGWLLDSVSVTHPTTGATRAFKHGKWLGTVEGTHEVELS